MLDPDLAAVAVLIACVAGAVTVMLVSAGVLPGGNAAHLAAAQWGSRGRRPRQPL